MKEINHNITIRNARINNLKGVDVDIPRNRFVVITGLSGSGKSSLAYDTLYAEGQRRYVESLSSYARQFLGRMNKPEVDSIKGLPPAIAVEQKVNTRNSRSTVGTSTEIYDYMRLLFARIGKTYSPVSGQLVTKHTVEDVIDAAGHYPEGTRIAVVAPIPEIVGRDFKSQLETYRQVGYSRLYRDGRFFTIDEVIDTFAGSSSSELDGDDKSPCSAGVNEGYMLLIDRLAVAHHGDELNRLAESAETAFYEGDSSCSLIVWDKDSPVKFDFSTRFEADGIKFIEPDDLLFNFNNPFGACPECEGYGRTVGIDESLVIPDPNLSVYQDAVACWRGDKMSQWKRELIQHSPVSQFPIHRPYCDLTEAQRDYLWHGDSRFGGIDGFFKMVEDNQYKIQYRVMLSRYRGKTLCPVCHGSRLRPETEYIKVGGKSISQLNAMAVTRLIDWFDNLNLDSTDAVIADRLLTEIKSRLRFLDNVGLGYLTLDRGSATLSGGESQRINLATSLGSSLVGSLYILDEPSIGLHPRDTDRLIGVLKQLKQIGNTVVVVEHDDEIISAADYIIDVGPRAGRLGGEIVFQGTPDRLCEATNSLTAKYMTGEMSVPLPGSRRRPTGKITVKGVRHHNLKGFDVDFPLGVMTVVTGVSGSGKSTLVRDILYRAIAREKDIPVDAPGAFGGLSGDIKRISSVEFVDQSPIGRSTRSNPATYLKAYDEIRYLFAETQYARQMGFPASYFSFNTEGGRCEECKGEGVINVEMQFMADLQLECPSCHGKRFKPDVLDVTYRDKSIYDVLEMTVNQAIEFFSEANGTTEARIVRRLQPLSDVGLGYIKLGQSSSTLSGGENQRVKLAYYLSAESQRPTMFIFDEPTTGLHVHDINTLLDTFDRLIARGHTIVIIEHNLDVIKRADHIIDIGPDGGDAGGSLVAVGTPEHIAANPDSITGCYLAPRLKV